MNSGKLWTRDFILVSLINFLLILVYFLLMVTIAGYAVEQFHASTSIAGLVSGIFIIGTLIGRLVTGRFIVGAGSRKTLTVGLILFIIETAFYFGAVNLPLLLLNRLFHGMALGVASTATGTIVAQVIPPARRGEGIGYFSLGTVLATAVGPFIGILFTRAGTYSPIFIFNLVLAVVCLIISFAVNVPLIKPSQKGGGEGRKGFSFENYIEKKSIPISFVALFVGFCYSGIIAFLTFYSRKIGLVEASSFFFLVYSGVMLVSRPFSGRLFDLKGANIIIYPCLAIFAAGMLLFSRADSGFGLLMASALLGLGYGNFTSVAQTVSLQGVPAHRLGLATSTYFIFFDLGLGAGPYILGFFIPLIGYRGLYFSLVFVILISLALYYFLHGRKERTLETAV